MGFEVLALLLVLGSGTMASVCFWIWRGERAKSLFVAQLASSRGVFLAGHESGDLARPLTLDLDVDGLQVRATAVVRGEAPLWQVKLEGVSLPVRGVVVVVDRAHRASSHAARDLPVVDICLGSRLLLLCAHAGDAYALVERPGARDDLARVLLARGVARQCVIEAGRVFLEVPRTDPLVVDDLLLAVARARALVCIARGDEVDLRAVLPPVAITSAGGVDSPSGNPVAVLPFAT